jgi:hypothetical protein
LFTNLRLTTSLREALEGSSPSSCSSRLKLPVSYARVSRWALAWVCRDRPDSIVRLVSARGYLTEHQRRGAASQRGLVENVRKLWIFAIGDVVPERHVHGGAKT